MRQQVRRLGWRLMAVAGACAAPLLVWAQGMAIGAGDDDPFKAYVEADGTISVPDNYRLDYVHLGTFAAAGGDAEGGQAEFHQVYIDPASLDIYQNTGEFPDGTVILKELQAVTANDLTTGHISYWTGAKGWFVMIKDSQGRYPDSPIWGDGWGWALFGPDDPTTPTNADYKEACIGCHTPVQATDWIHTWAYPLLEAKADFAKSTYAE